MVVNYETKDESNIFLHQYIDVKDKCKDVENLSLDELLKLQQELEETFQVYEGLQLVVKRNANSLYGSSGSEYFSLADFDLAEDITQSGKHAGVIVDKELNRFLVEWGEKELKIIQEFYPQVKELRKFIEYVPDTKHDFCLYGDTDSRYFSMELIYDLMGIPLPVLTEEGDKELADFTLFFVDKFVNKIIAETLALDIKKRNATDGYLKMAHEVTSRMSIFLGKKMYVMNIIFKDGKMLKKNYMKLTGVQLNKGELNKNMKHIIKTLVIKFVCEGASVDDIRKQIHGLMKYIKERNDKNFIFKYTGVNGMSDITKLPEPDKNGNHYTSTKNHIQMQVAKSWYNHIAKYKLEGEYKAPFEGQKMMWYKGVDKFSKPVVVGVPDDVELSTVKNLPQPDWKILLSDMLVKPMMKYIIEDLPTDKKGKALIKPQDVDNFLLNVKKIDLTTASN